MEFGNDNHNNIDALPPLQRQQSSHIKHFDSIVVQAKERKPKPLNTYDMGLVLFTVGLDYFLLPMNLNAASPYTYQKALVIYNRWGWIYFWTFMTYVMLVEKE